MAWAVAVQSMRRCLHPAVLPVLICTNVLALHSPSSNDLGDSAWPVFRHGLMEQEKLDRSVVPLSRRSYSSVAMDRQAAVVGLIPQPEYGEAQPDVPEDQQTSGGATGTAVANASMQAAAAGATTQLQPGQLEDEADQGAPSSGQALPTLSSPAAQPLPVGTQPQPPSVMASPQPPAQRLPREDAAGEQAIEQGGATIAPSTMQPLARGPVVTPQQAVAQANYSQNITEPNEVQDRRATWLKWLEACTGIITFIFMLLFGGIWSYISAVGATIANDLRAFDLLGAATAVCQLVVILIMAALLFSFCIYIIAKSISHYGTRKTARAFSTEKSLATLEAVLQKLRGPIAGDPRTGLQAAHAKMLSFMSNLSNEATGPPALYMGLVVPDCTPQTGEDKPEKKRSKSKRSSTRQVPFASEIESDRFDGWRNAFIGWWNTELDYTMFCKFSSPLPEGRVSVSTMESVFMRVNDKGLGELHLTARTSRQKYCFVAQREDGGKTAERWCDGLLWVQTQLDVIQQLRR
eukprot:TRINITY_DN111563_c0_g1_i1.p1 TRINITY_DN111563_c0_g1~~TRINITY_DN111563_c0_g1_i1.p1  ORF type:complete len:520 (-),score=61.31 TRINITY_DN111563_c0_g1_i1:84-1643(-)